MASAAAALRLAARAMQAAPGYTFSAVVTVGSSQIHVTGEFQAPDRVHEVVTSDRGSRAELVLLGSQTFARNPATGTWHRSTTASTTTDPRTAFSVLQDAQNVRVVGQNYEFTLTPTAAARLVAGVPATAPASGVANVTAGTISSLHISLSVQGRVVGVSLDYGSVGSAPAVTVPPTGG